MGTPNCRRVVCSPPHLVCRLNSCHPQIPTHHQHGHSVHAPLLYDPLLHQIPPKREYRTPPALIQTPCLLAASGRKGFILLSSTFQIISQTTLFLAAKVEEQPRKLEHVIKIAHTCISPQDPAVDPKSNVSFAP